MTFLDPAAPRRDGTQPYYPHGTGPFATNRAERRAKWFSYPAKIRRAFLSRYQPPQA